MKAILYALWRFQHRNGRDTCLQNTMAKRDGLNKEMT